MLLGGLSLVLSAAWGPLGGPLAWAAAWLLSLTQTIVLWGVAQPLGHRFVVGPTWGWVLVFYALLALAALAATKTARHPEPTLGPAGSTAAASGGCWQPGSCPAGCSPACAAADATLEAEFLAVGHGLAVLIHTPDGQTLLYDCGRLGDPTVGRRIIAPALWARGVSRIDTVFLSHADQDHYDGLPDLLDRFPIGEVRLPPGFAGRGQSHGDPADRTTSGTRRPGPADHGTQIVGTGRRSVHGFAPAGRLAPGNLRQRPKSRARRRLPRAPSPLDG